MQGNSVSMNGMGAPSISRAAMRISSMVEGLEGLEGLEEEGPSFAAGGNAFSAWQAM